MTLERARWWVIRPAANRKPATYRCPLCGRLLPSLSEHMLLLPEGDGARRRHAPHRLREHKTDRIRLRIKRRGGEIFGAAGWAITVAVGRLVVPPAALVVRGAKKYLVAQIRVLEAAAR